MKTCTRCGETKLLDQFPPVRRGKPRLQSWCRSCFAKANAKNYPAYYARERDRILTRIAGHRDHIRHQIIDYLRSHPCVDCGETDIVVLEFDHQGDKVADVSTFAMGGRTWETIMAEIDKCGVRCANCHRLRTAEAWSKAESGGILVTRSSEMPKQLLLDVTQALRECRVCGELKPLSQYPFRSITKQTHQWICLACQRAYSRHWYRRNRPRQLANVRKNNTKRRAAAAAEVRSYLETHACVDCGETNPRLLEFDHVRDKSYEISYLVRMGASKKQIAAEIEKCEVRCANCHRRKTAERGDWYRVVMA